MDGGLAWDLQVVPITVRDVSRRPSNSSGPSNGEGDPTPLRRCDQMETWSVTLPFLCLDKNLTAAKLEEKLRAFQSTTGFTLFYSILNISKQKATSKRKAPKNKIGYLVIFLNFLLPASLICCFCLFFFLSITYLYLSSIYQSSIIYLSIIYRLLSISLSSIYLSIYHLSIIYLFIIYLSSIYVSIIYLSSIYLSMYLSIIYHLSIIYLSIYLSI